MHNDITPSPVSAAAAAAAVCQVAEEGEASTAYFFNLEKQGQARLFTAITTVSGVIVKSFSLIAQAWILFYTTLFTAQSLLRSEQDFFLSHLTRFLTFAERRSCEGLLTNKECKAALDKMPTGKSGLDGLPAEFFKTFWPLMGQDMVDVLNYCYLSQRLSSTQRCGVITLLFKKGDRMQMKNWRPITLLCVDYKIAAKAIANRLLSVLPSVIHSDQVCGIIGRHISAKTRLLQDIVDDLNNRGMGSAILSLDQEKAFDRVDWAFLLRVLRKMNFGDSFCQ